MSKQIPPKMWRTMLLQKDVAKTLEIIYTRKTGQFCPVCQGNIWEYHNQPPGCLRGCNKKN